MVPRQKEKIALLETIIEKMEQVMLNLYEAQNDEEYEKVRKRKALLEEIKKDISDL